MRKQCKQPDARYWQRNAITYYLMWLATLAWTAWEATAGREGFWWELASWLVPALILGAAVFMGAVLIGLYLRDKWQI
ncbi:MAG: hypothetical protein KH230_26040 [Enterocloster asparagiformis]|nr:hypothetical protein [Enterocloster asparagiformis]